ncbi:MAG: hypothetical protein LBD20_05650 [Spirochaetaceae bacterium]|jgi:glucose-6-phosphate-specific signal transduction histidine kinase|nr:hypothetical protein [Spirochaetaceae bacterium]
MYLLRSKYKCIIILIVCAAVLQSGCATTKGYEGYAGYHTYKTDTASSKKLTVLLVFLGPVLTIPMVYVLNEFYLHNRVLNFLFTTAKLDAFFKALGDILL